MERRAFLLLGAALVPGAAIAMIEQREIFPGLRSVCFKYSPTERKNYAKMVTKMLEYQREHGGRVIMIPPDIPTDPEGRSGYVCYASNTGDSKWQRSTRR